MTTMPPDEDERLVALRDLAILDTPAEAHFDAVCRTARAMFGVALAAVNLVDAERYWLKAQSGDGECQGERADSFCTHTIEGDDVLVVEDAARDPRFAGMPLVTEAGVRFYAGAPLVLRSGVRVGALCLVDSAPRSFGAEDRERLRDLATIVVAQLRLQQEIVARKRLAAAHDRRRAALGEANRLLELAEQIGEVGHWRFHVAEGRREWSREVYRIFGIDPAGPPPAYSGAAEYHPEDRERVQAALRASAAEGTDFGFEARIVRPEGEVRHVLMRGICEKGADGRATSLFGVAIDLTDQKRMRSVLAQSDARYRALSDALPQIMWVMRLSDGQATYVNAQFERFYGPIGLERAARIVRNHPEDAARMEAAWVQARLTDSPLEMEGRLRGADGRYRWHKLAMTPILRDGAVAEWLGTALDIDDIVSARSALEETGDLLRLAQEAADAGPWAWDLHTGTMRLSPGSARLHGVPSEADVAMPTAEWTSLVHPDDRSRLWQSVREAVEAGGSLAAEFRTEGAGRVQWVRTQGRVLYGGDGRPSRMVGLHFDISARKAVEEALRDSTARAEAAQLIAETASKAKSEFLATMSHEIRTPLNGILGYADVLAEEGPLTERQRVHVERVRSAGAALLTVVNDVLDFSKIEAGQVEIDSAPFVPATLVDGAVAIVRRDAERKGLVLTADVDPAVPACLVGDEGRLRQVLLNLLANAIKFTVKGRVTLTVACAPGEGTDSHLRFAITDSGIGIPLDKRDRLFERFSQIDGSTQRRFGGTGLGLAISKRLVTLMGGAIGVESEEGVGSTFWFEVALAQGEGTAGTGEAAPHIAHSDAGRLLLVEDVPMNQDLARMILEARGYRVDVAADGAKAVQAVETRTYDLVLMDVQMPVMDGLTAARRIRSLKDARLRSIPIVAMTANVLPEQVALCREAGMDDCIGKPFRREELYAAVERWLPERSRAVAPPGPALLDESVYESIREIVGTERIGELLAELASELRTHFDDTPARPDREKLSFAAHAMASASGMLGFVGFSELCRELEAACVSNEDLGPLVGKLANAQAATLERIATLIAA